MHEQLLKNIQQLVLTIPSLAPMETRIAQAIQLSQANIAEHEEANDKMEDGTHHIVALLQDLSTSIATTIASEAYKQDVHYIEQLHHRLQAENEVLHTLRQSVETTTERQQSPIIFEQWLQHEGLQFQQQLPIAQWQQAVQHYYPLVQRVIQFNAQAVAYTSERYTYTSSFAKRFWLTSSKRRQLNAEGKHLQSLRIQLASDVAVFDQSMAAIRVAWQEHAPMIVYANPQRAIEHRLYTEKAEQQLKRNKDAYNELARIMRKWRPFVELDVLLDSLQQQFHSSHVQKLAFPHAYTYLELERMLQTYNEALTQPISVASMNVSQHALVLPDIQEELFQVQTATLRSYRKFATIPLTAAILAGSYAFTTTYFSEQLDDVTSSLSFTKNTSTPAPSTSTPPTTAVEPANAASPKSATIQPDGVRQTVGYVVASHDKVPIYSHPDADKAPIGYLTAGESYKVLAVSERMRMKLSANEWLVYDADDMHFEQEELTARLQPIYAPLHEATVTSKIVPIFSEPTRDSDVIGYLEDTDTVSFYNTAVGEWIDIGNNAWVEEMKYLSISWPYAANLMSNPIGQLTVTTSQFLNVRNKPGISGQIVGRLDQYETVYIYNIDRATGWLQVGENGWVSGKEKYVNYEVY